MSRPVRVGLIFHSTKSSNMGVGALTVAQIEILRGIGRDLGREIAITVIDWPDPRPPYVAGPDIEVVPMRMREIADPRGFYRRVRGLDLVIDIGAGDSFADIYGGPRLRRMFAMKAAVHLARRPLVVAPQTVGPFTRPASRRMAAATLRRSAVVASRDRMSTEAARDLAPGLPVIEASDVALRLPCDAPAPRPGGAPPRVGLNVSGLLMNGGYTRANMFGLKADYPAAIRSLIRAFLDHPSGCELHLVPHVIPESRGEVEDDLQPSLDLAAEFPGLRVAPAFASPSEAKSYIAGMDFFAGARMHACIAAFSSGVPVVPMAYSRKFAGLFGSLGYDHTVDCTAEPEETIVARVLEGYENRAALERDRVAALDRGLGKLGLYEAALRDLIAGLEGR